MKVLFVASEAMPFIKSGGLGDVVGSLPKTLLKQGIEVKVMIPNYCEIAKKYKENMQEIRNYNVSLGWRNQYCGLLKSNVNGIDFYFLDNEYYFKRPSMYGYYDEAERFSFFCKGVMEGLKYLDFMPDIIHCHDWQTALIPLLLKQQYAYNNQLNQIKTVFTIHNLRYQGIFDKGILPDLLGIDRNMAFKKELEFYGSINIMKAAIYYSDIVTTVSETYAQEIQTEYYGERLDGVIRENNYKLEGILNGLPYSIFNPNADNNIYHNYHDYKTKVANKVWFQDEYHMNKGINTPLISIVSRLTEQKGLDLIIRVIEEIMNMDVQLVVLGVGDKKYEDVFSELEKKYPDRVKIFLQFDIKLAQKIYAASDIFLMPSLFEPCGLSQLIALRYGAIPIVRGVGGLKDTVKPYDTNQNKGTGFVFYNYNAHELLYKVQEAVNIYTNEPEEWISLVERAMNQQFSWDESATQYIKLYQSLFS